VNESTTTLYLLGLLACGGILALVLARPAIYTYRLIRHGPARLVDAWGSGTLVRRTARLQCASGQLTAGGDAYTSNLNNDDVASCVKAALQALREERWKNPLGFEEALRPMKPPNDKAAGQAGA
jgi:hypothetical protein